MILLSILLACSQSDNQTVSKIEPKVQNDERPSILMVVLDTVRADALNLYGNKRPIGSNVSQLAKQGTTFEQAWSTGSWTWPSHASLFTGLLPWEHGAHFTDPGPDAISLKPDPFMAAGLKKNIPTLAEELGKQGYESYAISANRLIGPAYGLTRGFDHSEFIPFDGNVAKRAIEVIQTKRKKPLFLFVNLMSAHAPYFWNDLPWLSTMRSILDPNQAPDWLKGHLIPKEFGIHLWLPTRKDSLVFKHLSKRNQLTDKQLQIIRDLYEGEVALTDFYYGQIQNEWDKQFDNSFVAVTSDHGEYFGEHGQLEHGRTAYPEVLHVPLVLRGKGIKADQQIETPVSNHWIHGDIKKAAGLQSNLSVFTPKDKVWSGAWSDTYWSKELGQPYDQGWRAMRKGTATYVLREDGTCLKNIHSTWTETPNCEPLAEMRKTFVEAQTGQKVTPSESELNQLKTLGYIGGD